MHAEALASLATPDNRSQSYLNSQQAATELGIAVTTLYEWVKRDWVAGAEKWGGGKRGGRLRFRSNDFKYTGPLTRMGPIPGNAAGRVAHIADEGDPMAWDF